MDDTEGTAITMKFTKTAKALFATAAIALALAACGGGGDTKATNPPTTKPEVTTTVEATTTTAEATTTTEPAPEFAYEIVLTGDVVRNERGEYSEPIPAGMAYLYTAKNLAHEDEDVLTLGDIVALAPGIICVHNGFAGADGVLADASVEVVGTGLFSYMNSSGQPVEFIGIQGKQFGLIKWFNAAKAGVVPEPDGLTWDPNAWATLGECLAP